MSSISCCGIVCTDCAAYPRECSGCNAVKGAPYWLSEGSGEVCPLYGCCVGGKKFLRCGSCKELPCSKFFELEHPTTDKEERRFDIINRVSLLRSLNF